MAARYEDLGTRIAEKGMETPDFLGYDAYFYMGMYFDNVAGFSDDKYGSPLEIIWIQGRPARHPPPRVESVKQNLTKMYTKIST